MPSSVSSPPARPEPVWTEPPCSWFIETTEDALLILEAARRGLIPRVTRRLVDRERRMITSGSVFVFDEDESGIKRWTDGLLWSPSRILGNFLLYRETDKKSSGSSANAQATTNEPSALLMPDPANTSPPARKESTTSLSRPKDGRAQADRNRERALVGSLTNSYKFKPDGLMKKTFSLTINGSAQHLISYYKVVDVEEGRLRTPSSLPELSVLDISPEYLDKTHFRCPPKVEIDNEGVPRYRGEADDPDSPVRASVQPPAQHHMQSQVPLLTSGGEHAYPYSPSGYYSHSTGPDTSYFAGSGSGRAARRYEPYGGSGPVSSTSTAASSKRSRSRRGTGAKGYVNSGSVSPEGAGSGLEPVGYAPQYQGYTYGNGSGSYAPSSPSGSSHSHGHYSQYSSAPPPPPPPPASMTPAPQYPASSSYQDGYGSSYYGHSSTPAPPTPAPNEENYHSNSTYGSYAGYSSSAPTGGSWNERREVSSSSGGYQHPGVAWSAEVHGS
ncbi:cAMP-independent regulatory protein pac2 [Ceratobasidium sp. AG-Ba]|nr:cAMP-independent regulatory protein pac2 [Ceratobasidium sp. AG-Ba]